MRPTPSSHCLVRRRPAATRLLGAWAATALLGCNKPEDVAVHDTLPLADEIAAKGALAWPADELPFDWIPTVWVWGVLRLGAASEDPQWHAYGEAWMDDGVARVQAGTADFVSSDSMSPSLIAASLMADEPSLPYQPVLDAADAYLEAAPRTDEGAIEHWTEEATFGVPGQVWVDSQFMFGLYLLERWRATGDRAFLDAFVEQYVLFSELCRDPADQLYRHAYDDETDANIPADAVYWARGNSWVLVSAAELLARVDADDPAAEAVRPLFVAHVEAVVAHQQPDGLWHTVLNDPIADDPLNYPETSASALIAYAIAVGLRAGALPEDELLPVLAKAVDGVAAQSEGGVVRGTSYGTNPGDYDYYVGIGVADDLMLGVGAVTMLLAEAHGLHREAP